VAALFAEYLARQGLLLQLNHLRRGACLASRLAEEMAMRAWTMQEEKIHVCPYIDLRGQTWDTYMAAVGPGFRRSLSRCLQNLHNSFQARVDCVRRPADAQAALDVVIDLHRRRWSARGTSEAFQSEAVVGFHREFVHHAAKRGWLRLVILRLNEAPVAALYGLRYGPTFYFYQSGFDPAYGKHSVGVATMALTIRLAIEEQASEYDLLHGDEEYKFHWTRSARDLSRIELHPPCRKAWVWRRAIELNRAARRLARRVLITQGIHRR
jgi:CelD/BcsL family acetyltransferase involved in cellulose biosynthesis